MPVLWSVSDAPNGDVFDATAEQKVKPSRDCERICAPSITSVDAYALTAEVCRAFVMQHLCARSIEHNTHRSPYQVCSAIKSDGVAGAPGSRLSVQDVWCSTLAYKKLKLLSAVLLSEL